MEIRFVAVSIPLPQQDAACACACACFTWHFAAYWSGGGQEYSAHEAQTRKDGVGPVTTRLTSQFGSEAQGKWYWDFDRQSNNGNAYQTSRDQKRRFWFAWRFETGGDGAVVIDQIRNAEYQF